MVMSMVVPSVPFMALRLRITSAAVLLSRPDVGSSRNMLH
jgi:hypothetical protein